MTRSQQTPCPSRLQLDRMRFGELGGEDLQDVEVHLESCGRCASWVEEAETEEQGIDPARMARLSERLRDTIRPARREAAQRSGVWSWLARRGPILAAAGCAVALSAVLILGPSDPPADRPPADDIQIKGATSYKIHCKRKGRVFELMPGDPVVAGDALRLEIFSEDLPHLLVISIQEDGETSCYVPFSGRRSAKIPVGRRTLLEGSLVLDDSDQDELLVFLFSQRPLEAKAAKTAARSAYRAASGRLSGIKGFDLGDRQHLRRLRRKK